MSLRMSIARVPRGTMAGLRTLLLPLLLLALLAPGAFGPQAARADDSVEDAPRESLQDLVTAYEGHLILRNEGAYAKQRDALERIVSRRTDDARKVLMKLLKQYGGIDRRRTELLLGAWIRYGTPTDLDRVIDYVEGRKDPLEFDLLHRILGEATRPATLAHLRDGALRSATPRVKAQIVRALGASRDEANVAPLLKLVREENLLVRIETLEALGRLRSKRTLPVVQVFLRDANPYVRDAAARGLGYLGDPRALPALRRALHDASARVIESVAGAMAQIGGPGPVPDLIDGLQRAQGKDLRLEDAFTSALQTISGKDIQADHELWRGWWLAVKDKKPFAKAQEKPGRKTVPGPSYYGFPVRSSKVVFILDVSRSMGWNGRLDTAKRELIQTLGKLPATTRFNVIIYSDRVWRWKKALTAAKSAAVKRAITFVRSQKPLNGTNSYGALAAAFEDPDADTIFFMSDGHPSVGRVTDPDLILSRIRDWNQLRRVRVHAVALLRGLPPAAFMSIESADRSAAFMKRLAKQNSGRFKKIE